MGAVEQNYTHTHHTTVCSVFVFASRQEGEQEATRFSNTERVRVGFYAEGLKPKIKLIRERPYLQFLILQKGLL